MDDSLNLIPVTLSEYVKSLNHEDVAFYIEKLTVDGVQLPDPYGITKSCWDNDVNKWPDISYPDIYQYFVETSCFYLFLLKSRGKKCEILGRLSVFCARTCLANYVS